ncbi:MAG: hypothetical protein CK423_08295 [Legionella sp.]|nr:MAG: hypothetical protein CK423_08295 [Legionella sp.]
MQNYAIQFDEISELHKKLEKLQNQNQAYKANIQKLLTQHKKLTSLTTALIQVLESDSPLAQKQASITNQIRLFKQHVTALSGESYGK